MKNKRAQLSIETMIIYGLVILVTLSVIGGLIYFNILDLGSYLPDKCDIGGTGSDLKCEEWSFVANGASSEIVLGIRNIGQKPIDTLVVSVTDQSAVQFSGEKSSSPGGSATYTDSNNDVKTIGTGTGDASLPPGEIAKVTIPTGSALAGKLLRGTLKTQYKFTEGAITQEATGSIRIKAS
jgi:hypothetical protein